MFGSPEQKLEGYYFDDDEAIHVQLVTITGII